MLSWNKMPLKHIRIIDDGYSTDQSDNSSSDSDNNNENDNDNYEPDYGILFDVDGVLARGSKPLKPAIEAIKHLKNGKEFRVPVAFVTNACSPRKDKAAVLSRWLDVEVPLDTVIIAPSPCSILTEYHKKHVLVIGQENRKEIAEDLGFENICFIEDIKDSYPLLDIVNHENRRAIARGYLEKKFPKVEAILLLGEPTEWESHLQLLIDLLLTEGLPTKAPDDPTSVRQLPVIACNLDLQFMAEACMPRFGHGAFLVCLEALYKKITGNDLAYSVLVGKPCELTYRYAEHVISTEAKRLGITRPITKLYFIGDNHQVDVVGCNLYNKYVQRNTQNRNALKNPENNPTTNNNLNTDNNPKVDNLDDNLTNNPSTDTDNNRNAAINPNPDTTNTADSTYIPQSRRITHETVLNDQTVEQCISLLVCTGIFKPDHVDFEQLASVHHGHRDIEHDVSLSRPTKIVEDVLQGIKFIFENEGRECNG